MAVVNVRRDVDDKFYRYRMPLLTTKIEGKGNGIKTVVPNMSAVAQALTRPPSYPTKFFGFELGAQTTLDESHDRYIVNGAHQADRLRELLDVFIDKFVLCGSCKNPETEYVFIGNKKNQNVEKDCKACGERSPLDARHKLTGYIVKNPPPKKLKGKKGDAAAGVGGNGAEENGSGSGEGEDAGENGDDDDDFLTKKIKAEAAEMNAETKLADKEDDWSADTSPEAVKQRMKAMEQAMGALSTGGGGDDDDDDEGANSPYNALGEWIFEQQDEEDDPKALSIQIYKKAEDLGIEKKYKTIPVLVQALFTDEVLKEIPQYGALFAKMVTSEKHQKALLGGIERLVGVAHPDLIPSVPKILMALYQLDLLDEDLIKDWGTHVSKKYVDKDVSKRVRKASAPFLKWLDEADDDSDEE